VRGSIRNLRWLLLAVALPLSGCRLVLYTQALVDADTGRTPVVIYPASFGGVVGVIASVPVGLLALPITYPIYSVQKAQDPESADPTVMLLPTWFLWQTGVFLAGAPLDLLEFVFYRSWAVGARQPPPPPDDADAKSKHDTQRAP
jgi:hypothetical protein